MEILKHLDVKTNYSYTISIFVNRNMKIYPLGKSWPYETTCEILVKNESYPTSQELVEDSVVKYHSDEHNSLLAIKKVLSKTLPKACLVRRIRKDIWKKFNELKEVKNYE